jgi:hypothetical protein
VYLGAYPRSGSTWTKFLLFEVLSRTAAAFENSSLAVPHVGDHSTALPLLPEEGRLIKTHEPYRPEYRKAVYVVRDVRDVILSEFAFQRWRGVSEDDLEAYIDAFINARTHGFGFPDWNAHVASWLDARDQGRGNIFIARYEDMRRDTARMLGEIVSFLGVEADPARIDEAIHNNTLRRMQKKEDEERATHGQFKMMGRNYSKGLRFIRKGATGGWQEQFSEEQVQRIVSYAYGPLSRLGYL